MPARVSTFVRNFCGLRRRFDRVQRILILLNNSAHPQFPRILFINPFNMNLGLPRTGMNLGNKMHTILRQFESQSHVAILCGCTLGPSLNPCTCVDNADLEEGGKHRRVQCMHREAKRNERSRDHIAYPFQCYTNVLNARFALTLAH